MAESVRGKACADNGRGRIPAYLVASGLLQSKAEEAEDWKGR